MCDASEMNKLNRISMQLHLPCLPFLLRSCKPCRKVCLAVHGMVYGVDGFEGGGFFEGVLCDNVSGGLDSGLWFDESRCQ